VSREAINRLDSRKHLTDCTRLVSIGNTCTAKIRKNDLMTFGRKLGIIMSHDLSKENICEVLVSFMDLGLTRLTHRGVPDFIHQEAKDSFLEDLDKSGVDGFALPEPDSCASDDDVRRFEESLSNNKEEDIDLTPAIFRSMVNSGRVKMLSRNVCQDNRDTSRHGYDKHKKVILCQDPGFVPRSKCKKSDSSDRIYLGIVYYVHTDGYIIACHREWCDRYHADKHDTGAYDFIGCYQGKPEKHCENYLRTSFLNRNYKLLKSTPSLTTGYRSANLCDENGCHSSPERVGVLVLSAFVGNRPFIDGKFWIQEHKTGDRGNDSFPDGTEWLSQSMNNDKDHQHRYVRHVVVIDFSKASLTISIYFYFLLAVWRTNFPRPYSLPSTRRSYRIVT
jgi:hypothetical protein